MSLTDKLDFMGPDFLLESEAARRLYHDHAAVMPICDYHSHLSPQEIADNRQFDNLAQLWLHGDHYKWRAMRAAGIDEHRITGNASDRERFQAWPRRCPTVWVIPSITGRTSSCATPSVSRIPSSHRTPPKRSGPVAKSGWRRQRCALKVFSTASTYVLSVPPTIPATIWRFTDAMPREMLRWPCCRPSGPIPCSRSSSPDSLIIWRLSKRPVAWPSIATTTFLPPCINGSITSPPTAVASPTIASRNQPSPRRHPPPNWTDSSSAGAEAMPSTPNRRQVSPRSTALAGPAIRRAWLGHAVASGRAP